MVIILEKGDLMTIRYPNGKVYKPSGEVPKVLKTKREVKNLSFSNRGKTLEDEINETNLFYLNHQIAVIHKKPVPIQIVKVEYPKRSAAVIREAYFRTASTTDYNGVWNGYYLDFEAKETESKTSFPLKNVHPHQIKHMEDVIKQQGIAFMIVRFSKLDRYFILPFQILFDAWNKMEKGGAKSIPLKVFELSSVEVSPGFNPRIDFLSAIEKLIANKE